MVLRQGRAVLSVGGVSTNPLWAPNLGVKDLCLRSLSPPELGDTGTKAGLKKTPQIYLHWLKKPKQNSAFSLTPSLKHLSVTIFHRNHSSFSGHRAHSHLIQAPITPDHTQKGKTLPLLI